MKAIAVPRQTRLEALDAARCELAGGPPQLFDWRGEARLALAPVRLGIDADGRISRFGGAPTGFILHPVLGGRSVYIRDNFGTRYWLGSPGRLRDVVRWLLS